MNALPGTPYFSYVRVLQQGEFLLDGFLHIQPCQCSRCLNLLFAAERVTLLLTPGASHELTSDGADGTMRLIVTWRGIEKPSRRWPPKPRSEAPPARRRRTAVPPAAFGEYLRGVIHLWARRAAEQLGRRPPSWREFTTNYARYKAAYFASRQRAVCSAPPSRRDLMRAQVKEECRSRAEAAMLP
jgi:hypothetical protein